MVAIEIILLGCLLLFGLWWQVFLFRRDLRHLDYCGYHDRPAVYRDSRAKNSRPPIPKIVFNLTFGFIFYRVLGGPPLPRRLIVPLVVSVVVVVGTLGYGMIVLFDENRKDYYFFSGYLLSVFKSFVFGGALLLKSWLGPVLTTACLAVCLYNYMEYGKFVAIPILSALIDWLFSKAPDWLEDAYVACMCLYVFASSTYDSVDHRWFASKLAEQEW